MRMISLRIILILQIDDYSMYASSETLKKIDYVASRIAEAPLIHSGQ